MKTCGKIESQSDQDAAYIGHKIRQKLARVRKGEIWIVESGRDPQGVKTLGRKV